MSKYPQPDLVFLESTDLVGFTAAGISSFRDISANAIVRELIQNSLDAAQLARTPKAVIRFSTTAVETKDIPGIKSYQSAFCKAVQRRTEETGLSDQDMMVVHAISEALNRDHSEVLVVADNGIGLDEKRMFALLSDGVSDKGKNAAGAFGVGHMSLFPVSDLRYILYSGICNGQWISSGHAILASHFENERDRSGRSANGYFLAGNSGCKHIYPEKTGMPPLIRSALSKIERGDGHGTAVIVLGFNRFKETTSLKDAVSKATACSFFPAVDEGQLEVVVDDSGASWTLKSGNLSEVIDGYKEQKRERDFLSGRKAYFSYNALVHGRRHDVSVLDGMVNIVVQHPAKSKTTRINLFRNGMWITNSDRNSGGIPHLYSAFSEYESFEALILVTAQAASQFHDLIRKAEGPSHNRLDLKLLEDSDRKHLRQAFAEISEFLKNLIPKFSDEPYNPSDFLALSHSAEKSPSGPRYGWDYHGVVTPIHRRISMQHSVGANPGGVSSRNTGGESESSGRTTTPDPPPRRPALPSNFTAVVTPAGPGRKRIRIRCTEDCNELELRLVVDDRTDVTTDRIWPDRLASIKNAKIGGTPVAPEAVLNHAIRLGRLHKGTTTEIEVEYALDGEGVPVLPDASLRVEIGAHRVDVADGEPSE